MIDPTLKLIAFNNTAFGSVGCADALAPHNQLNEGGRATPQESTTFESLDNPRLVIRGESLNTDTDTDCSESFEIFSIGGKSVVISTPLPKLDGEPYSAITDFLNCTFPFHSTNLTEFFQDLFKCLGSSFAPAKDRCKGLHGWEKSFQLGISKTFFAYGGQNGTGFISIPGEACHMIPSWHDLTILMRDKYNARITRWDGAVDDYEGSHSVDQAVQLYLNGQFNAGGSEPDCNQSGNWIKPNGKGRTFYVGKRENGKMARIYEKGMQLGSKWHPWVRWEVEMHNVDRVIPWDVLLEPGKYAAGAYPKAMGWVQVEMQRISTLKKTAQISYDHLTHFASVAYGKLFSVMLQVEGTSEKVLAKLTRQGIPARLDLPLLPKHGRVMP